MHEPLVSVLMPAYNCENYVGEAIRAILGQAFTDFEFIIINDGSTDNTKGVIQQFSDMRIRFYENEFNSGIIKTLNRGLDLAKGKYIFRTDADDIGLPDMLGSLTGFMEQQQDYVICGGNMQLIGSDKIFSYLPDNENLKVYTLNACPFSHSTVIFRKKIIDDKQLRYRETMKHGEDHALWSEFLPYGKFHNLDKVTLLYRESPGQVTATSGYQAQYNSVQEKIFAFHAKTYFDLSEEDTAHYIKLITTGKIISLDELNKLGEIMLHVQAHNAESRLFSPRLLRKMLFIKWHWICFNSYDLGRHVFGIYFKYLSGSKNLLRLKSLSIHCIKMIQSKKQKSVSVF